MVMTRVQLSKVWWGVLVMTGCAKRQLLCAGGYKQHDDHENDAHVQEVAQFAVKQVRGSWLAHVSCEASYRLAA